MSTHPGSILHIIDTTGPGGAETIFTQLAAHTEDLGCRSIAVIRGPGWVEQELARLGIETRILDCKGSFNIEFLRAVMRIIRTERIDLIQAHLLGSSLYASLAGLFTRKPVVCTFHGHVDVSPTERLRLAKFLVIQLGSKHIIAVTRQLRTMLTNIATVSSRKVKTIPNGIDTRVYAPGESAPFRQDFDIPPEAVLLGSLGNVRKAKNYNLAIDALHLLVQRGIEARLLIAGDDKNPLAEQHRRHAEELGIGDRTVWLGFYTDTPAFLNAIDVFLLSSSSEGHPLALTQAMAVGVPIVTTRCGVEEIVSHRDTALIAENGNSAQLADCIGELIKNQQLKQHITTNAQTLARETLSLTAMCERYQKLYDESLPAPHSGAAKRSWLSQRIADRYGSKKGLLANVQHSILSVFSGRYRQYQGIPETVHRVVFVCKGNICRSALAEYAFRAHSSIPTVSIGLDTHTGKEGNPRIAKYAEATGINMRSHRTTAVSDFRQTPGDLFVCMEPDHADTVEELYGPHRTILLGYFGVPPKLYIHDPYISSDNYAQSCTTYIVQTTENLAKHLNSTH